MKWIFANEPRRQRITIEIVSVFVLVNVGGMWDCFMLLGNDGAYFVGLVVGNGD